MPYKFIKFDSVPSEMLEICDPLFKELEIEEGAILFQVFRDGHGSGAFIPRKPYEKINAILVECKRKSD